MTLVDFPGRVAAIVFVQGCNFRCRYCHNPRLVLPQHFGEPLAPEPVLGYLNSMRGKLEGVVITGGEPTLQQDLVEFISRIKEMGFAVKLDTNGSHPEVLRLLIQTHLLDYIAMDIKTSMAKYCQITGVSCDIIKISESIRLINSCGIPYQFRTTLVKEFCSPEDLSGIQAWIGQANHYVLQPLVISENMIDPWCKSQDQYTEGQVELLKAQYERVGRKDKGERIKEIG